MTARSALQRILPSLRIVNHFLLGQGQRPRRPLRVRSFLYTFTRKLRTGIIEGSKDHVVRIHADRRIITMANDNGISKELLIFGEHEPLVTRIVKRVVTGGMTCLDVGSNIGYYVLLEQKLVGNGGLVIAFEPSKRAFGYLDRSIAANRLPNVRAYKLAIGDSDGIVYFKSSKTSNLSRVMGWKSGERLESVSSTRIDTFVSETGLQRIHFLRMDIEGYEYHAIAGAKETLARWKPSIVIEVHRELMGETMTIDLLRLLQSLGYEVVSFVPRGRDYPILNQRKYVVSTTLAALIRGIKTQNMPPKSWTFTLYLENA